MTLSELQAERRAKVTEARALYRTLTDKTPEKEARKIEREFDVLMAEVDDLAAQIDEAKDQSEAEEARMAKRPGVNPGTVRTGGEEEPVEVVTGIVPEARMADWARREYHQDAETYRGLSAGRFLRAMVLGATNDLERRALAGGTDSAGGFTVPTVLSAELIDLMRAASVASRAGARTVPLTSDSNVVARLATDPTPAWRQENAAITEADPTFDAVTFTPQSLAVLVKVSRELLEDSINLETELPRILTSALAQEWDRVALIGSGSAPEPRGVLNQSGILTTALDGAITNYAPLLTARTKLLSANHLPTAIIAHPRDEGTLAGLTATDDQPLMAPRQISEVPMLTTTAIPTDAGVGDDESVVFMGDFTRLMLGVRSQIRVEILRETFAGNHQYGFVCHLRGDVQVSHPKAFHTTTGVGRAA